MYAMITLTLSTLHFVALEKISENVTASDICIDGGKCTMYDDLAIQEILCQPDIDLVIITIGTGRNVEDEAHDRHTLNLPGHQNEFLLSTLDMAAGRGIIRRKPVPVVLLVFSSGPIDIEPAVEDENVCYFTRINQWAFLKS